MGNPFFEHPILNSPYACPLIERFYYLDIKYLDIKKALSGEADLAEAIVDVPADRIVRTNFGKALSGLIGSAMGKPMVEDHGADEPEFDSAAEDELSDEVDLDA